MAFQERKGRLSPETEGRYLLVNTQNMRQQDMVQRWAAAKLLGFESRLPLAWQCDLGQVTQCLSLEVIIILHN